MRSLLFQRRTVEIFRLEGPRPGAEKLRFDVGPGELLKGQAIVLEKAGHGYGDRRHDTGPAGSFLAGNGFQEEVHTYSHSHGQDCADKLPGGQAEENAFLVLAHFFRNFDFHACFLLLDMI